MSANDVLSFSVGSEIVTNYTVTQDDMDAGGFEQNLTVEGTSGICGDVEVRIFQDSFYNRGV